MVVWERGCGRTLACGTGACAAVVAGALTGRTDRRCVVSLEGGDLTVEWNGPDTRQKGVDDNSSMCHSDCVIKTGPARRIFDGVLPEGIRNIIQDRSNQRDHTQSPRDL